MLFSPFGARPPAMASKMAENNYQYWRGLIAFFGIASEPIQSTMYSRDNYAGCS